MVPNFARLDWCAKQKSLPVLQCQMTLFTAIYYLFGGDESSQLSLFVCTLTNTPVALLLLYFWQSNRSRCVIFLMELSLMELVTKGVAKSARTEIFRIAP